MLKVQSKILGGVAVLTLQGQLVNGETEILRDAVQSLSEVSAVRLDLARVTMIDAGGLGVMLGLRQQAQAKEVRFELMNVTRQIGMLLELTRLDTVFQIRNTVEFFPAVAPVRRPAVAAHASYA